MDKFEPQSPGLHVKEGHEGSDLNIGAIALFAVLLTLGVAAVFVGCWAFQLGMERWERKNDARLTPVEQQLRNERRTEPIAADKSPLPANEQGVKPPSEPDERAAAEAQIRRTFPTPRLQYDDVYDMNLFRSSENEWLNSTGRGPNGSIHIPIQRAMDMLAERGLPPATGVFTTEGPTGVPTNPSRSSTHQEKSNIGMRGDVSH